MSNDDGSLWLTYNGGFTVTRRFGRSWSVSECVAGKPTTPIPRSCSGPSSFGESKSLHKFRGMFAFALWDGRTREPWLVRDRIGIKPLYYSLHHRRLVYAWEIKALLEDPEQPRAVNDEEYLDEP
jgi:asparagine synthase (glutamine-hydrolysing)